MQLAISLIVGTGLVGIMVCVVVLIEAMSGPMRRWRRRRKESTQ
jgi:hypothetical protein